MFSPAVEGDGVGCLYNKKRKLKKLNINLLSTACTAERREKSHYMINIECRQKMILLFAKGHYGGYQGVRIVFVKTKTKKQGFWYQNEVGVHQIKPIRFKNSATTSDSRLLFLPLHLIVVSQHCKNNAILMLGPKQTKIGTYIKSTLPPTTTAPKGYRGNTAVESTQTNITHNHHL